MQEPVDVTQRMRLEWNERAREDAHYYVAFGRREQKPEEFFATANEVVLAVEALLRRFPANANRRAWRALEIGCGPGRLIKPLSRHFGEIHGIDVSDEMIERARRNLAGIPHAHVHATSGADLAPFADESFDVVYSYAVFQHIPSRDVVMNYLSEAHRVLKPDGILWCQINGLDKTAKTYDTWSGVRISADEVRDFAFRHDMQLLVLDGVRTQYMWATMRKKPAGWRPTRATSETSETKISRITNAQSSEPVVPTRGRFASFTIWLEDLPAECDLIGLEVLADGIACRTTYIGAPEKDGSQQLNVLLAEGLRTGLLPIEVRWNNELLCDPTTLRVIPPGPAVPNVLTVTDGVNVLSGLRIVSGCVKVTIEEVNEPQQFAAELDGRPVSGLDIFCADPMPPRYEINFDLPRGVPPGIHQLSMRLGSRILPTFTLEVASSS